MSVSWYTPQSIAKSFNPIKPTDSNVEFDGIALAFNNINAWEVFTGSGQLGGAVRNALVDFSLTVGSGNSIIIMLPQNPVLGDPPCRVSLLNSGYTTAPDRHSACYIQGDTVNNDLIDGSLTALPRIYNAGDYMEFVWVGGAIGWAIVGQRIGAYAPNDTFTNDGPSVLVSSPETYPFTGFDIVIGPAAVFGPALTLGTSGNMLANIGDRFFFTVTDAGAGALIGDSGGADTINGAASPVAFATVGRRYCVIKTAANAYEVS
jgi:hypothetical protein